MKCHVEQQQRHTIITVLCWLAQYTCREQRELAKSHKELLSAVLSSILPVRLPEVLCGHTGPKIQSSSSEKHHFRVLLREVSLSQEGLSTRALEKMHFVYSLVSLMSKSQTTNMG